MADDLLTQLIKLRAKFDAEHEVHCSRAPRARNEAAYAAGIISGLNKAIEAVAGKDAVPGPGMAEFVVTAMNGKPHAH